LFFCCLIHPAIGALSPFPLTATDDLGATIVIPSPPQRIISLSPSTTEIIYALGISDRLVGVTEYCDYPPEAKTKENVGGYINFSIEQVIALKPDVILAAHGNPIEVIDNIRKLGTPVFGCNPKSLNDVLMTIERIGQITGIDSTASRIVSSLRERVKTISDSVSKIPDSERPRVMWGGWDPPIYTAGPGSFINDLITLAGGKNVAADASTPWPQYSLETIVLKNPQILIIPDIHGNDTVKGLEDVKRTLRRRAGWNNIDAVKNGHIYYIDMQILGRPGPRLVDGLEQLAKCLYPGRLK
jgi:iron complex transport system substrate-binding protein